MLDIKYNKILIFDGSYALHRSLSVPSNWDMKTSSDIRTGGVFGVIRTIQKELKHFEYFPIVVFDSGLSERRLKLYPDYKRNQSKRLLTESIEVKSQEELLEEEFKIEYNNQKLYLSKILPLFSIPVIELRSWEGDDLIFILSRLCKDSVIVSDDKDMIQLVHQPDNKDNRICKIWRALNNKMIEYKNLADNGMTDISQFIGCKAIVGDPSDNIPTACYQVGEKTALNLYDLYVKILINNEKYPTNEIELTECCNKYNIPKRKAYLNFDSVQFSINYLLTDLSLVEEEVTEDIINNIDDKIKSDVGLVNNVDELKNILNILEFNTINYISLIDRVNLLKKYLYLENSDYQDVNINNSGFLF